MTFNINTVIRLLEEYVFILAHKRNFKDYGHIYQTLHTYEQSLCMYVYFNVVYRVSTYATVY